MGPSSPKQKLRGVEQFKNKHVTGVHSFWGRAVQTKTEGGGTVKTNVTGVARSKVKICDSNQRSEFCHFNDASMNSSCNCVTVPTTTNSTPSNPLQMQNKKAGPQRISSSHALTAISDCQKQFSLKTSCLAMGQGEFRSFAKALQPGEDAFRAAMAAEPDAHSADRSRLSPADDRVLGFKLAIQAALELLPIT